MTLAVAAAGRCCRRCSTACATQSGALNAASAARGRRARSVQRRARPGPGRPLGESPPTAATTCSARTDAARHASRRRSVDPQLTTPTTCAGRAADAAVDEACTVCGSIVEPSDGDDLTIARRRCTPNGKRGRRRWSRASRSPTSRTAVDAGARRAPRGRADRPAVALVLGLALSTHAAAAPRRACAPRRCASPRDGPDAPAAARRRPRRGRRPRPRARARCRTELRRQEAARRAFVATASHELRTPLTSLPGHAGAARGGPARRAARPRRRAATRSRAPRRELRRLSRARRPSCSTSRRLDAGGRSCARSRSSSASSRRAVAAEFELRAARRATSTLDVVPPIGPCWGRGDPDAVARVVRILIDNALRYAPPRRAGRASPPPTTAQRRRVEVADRGPGRPAEEREHDLRALPPRRGRPARRGRLRPRPGDRPRAGRAHGRHARARRRRRRGARFVLTLPAAAAPSPGPSPARDSVAAG